MPPRPPTPDPRVDVQWSNDVATDRTSLTFRSWKEFETLAAAPVLDARKVRQSASLTYLLYEAQLEADAEKVLKMLLRSAQALDGIATFTNRPVTFDCWSCLSQASKTCTPHFQCVLEDCETSRLKKRILAWFFLHRYGDPSLKCADATGFLLLLISGLHTEDSLPATAAMSRSHGWSAMRALPASQSMSWYNIVHTVFAWHPVLRNILKHEPISELAEQNDVGTKSQQIGKLAAILPDRWIISLKRVLEWCQYQNTLDDFRHSMSQIRRVDVNGRKLPLLFPDLRQYEEDRCWSACTGVGGAHISRHQHVQSKQIFVLSEPSAA